MELTAQLQQWLQKVYASPEQFNELSRQTILTIAKSHNQHNRLLPPDFIADIIEQISTINPFQNRKSSIKFCFYYNILRHVVISNFFSLQDNKVFAVISQIYAQKLNLFYHEMLPQEKSLAIIRHIAQMGVINEITLKYAIRTKIFFPEFIRTLKISIIKLEHSISRNLKHTPKTQNGIESFSSTQGLFNIAFSKQTEKDQLIFILIALLNNLLKQSAAFFTASSNKKQVLKLNDIQFAIQTLERLEQILPQNIKTLLVIPPEFKKYQEQQGEQNLRQDEPIFLEEPIQVRELTPRFYNEQQATQTKLLRKKKNKLQKRMHLQLRQTTHQKLQERRVVENVKKQKAQQRFKKQTFILQKQTQQAKKAFKQNKKVKIIKKQSKLGRKGKK